VFLDALEIPGAPAYHRCLLQLFPEVPVVLFVLEALEALALLGLLLFPARLGIPEGLACLGFLFGPEGLAIPVSLDNHLIQ
jgi:hypothetical protein